MAGDAEGIVGRGAVFLVTAMAGIYVFWISECGYQEQSGVREGNKGRRSRWCLVGCEMAMLILDMRDAVQGSGEVPYVVS